MSSKRAVNPKGTGGALLTVNSATSPATAVPVAVVAEPVTVTLPADCRIAAQAALKEDLLGVLAADAITLDGRAVERIDTAALQLLLVFQRELDARGGKLGWRGTSNALDEAAGLLGLAQILKLPAATPA